MGTFYYIFTIKCDQKAEYGTIKSSIVRISPLYVFQSLQNEYVIQQKIFVRVRF